MTTAKLLEDGHLFALTGGDSALRDDILLSFLESADELVGSLSVSCSGDEWRRIGHKLKGLAASVGAEAMAALAARMSLGIPDTEIISSIQQNFTALEIHIRTAQAA